MKGKALRKHSLHDVTMSQLLTLDTRQLVNDSFENKENKRQVLEI